jgi:hypothetical protein
MKIYELFGKYLDKSKKINEFVQKDQNLLFEALKMDIGEEAITKYLSSIGREIDIVLDFIEKMKTEREEHIAALIKHC